MMAIPTAFEANGHGSYFGEYDHSEPAPLQRNVPRRENEPTIVPLLDAKRISRSAMNSFADQQNWRTQRLAEMIEHMFNDTSESTAQNDEKVFIRHFGSRTFGEPEEFKLLNDQIDNDIWAWKKSQEEAKEVERKSIVNKRRDKQRKKMQTKMRLRYEESLLRREPHAVKRLLEYLREGDGVASTKENEHIPAYPSPTPTSEAKSLPARSPSSASRTIPIISPKCSLPDPAETSQLPPTPLINECRGATLQRPKSAPINLVEKRMRQLAGVQRYWESQSNSSVAQHHIKRLQIMQNDFLQTAQSGVHNGARNVWNSEPTGVEIPTIAQKRNVPSKSASTSRPRSATASLYKSTANLSTSLETDLLAPCATLHELNEFDKRILRMGLT